MENLTITTVTALAMGLWFLVLTWRVILRRRVDGIVLGTGEDRAMEKAIRGQANAAEQIPLFLIFLGLAEYRSGADWLLILATVLFCAGRLSHGLYFSWHGLHWRLRLYGMAATLGGQGLALAALAVTLL